LPDLKAPDLKSLLGKRAAAASRVRPRGCADLLADTSFIIDLMLGDEKAVRKAKDLVDDSVPQAAGTPTIFE
jgi:hypothetical protein